MSRQKDYQPTIDRQRAQNTDLKRMLAEQRAIAKSALRDNSHLRYAVQVGNEENDDLRLAMLVQDSIVADLRAELAAEREKTLLAVIHLPPDNTSWFREKWRSAAGRVMPTLFSGSSESA